MNIHFLIFANTIIILVYLFYTRTYKTKITIDHFVLLLAGIIFYWLMPIYAYENNLDVTHHFPELYKSIQIENVEMFLYFTLRTEVPSAALTNIGSFARVLSFLYCFIVIFFLLRYSLLLFPN